MANITKILTLAACAAILSVSTAFAGNCSDCKKCDSDKKAKATATAVKAVAFPDVDHATLTKAIKKGTVTLIDVNGSKSFKSGHIPGAIDFASVNKESLMAMLPEDKNAFIVAYCGGPKCGAYKKAAQLVASMGYTDVHHYSGGISGWKAAGETVGKAG